MGGDHKCPVCQATFTRPQHVARHMRSHTGDRPYKCQYCGDQFARSDLLSRHINKCHANEKPPPNATGGRRKGSAALSRATTSKQACDQCVQSSLPCDGSNPCSKCVSRKCRCTYVKFHRQTAPIGPGHQPPRPAAVSGSARRLPEDFLSAPPPAGVTGMDSCAQLFTQFQFSPGYPLASSVELPSISMSMPVGTTDDLAAKYSAHANSLRPSVPMSLGAGSFSGLYTTQPQQTQTWYGWSEGSATTFESGRYPPLDDKDFQTGANHTQLPAAASDTFEPEFCNPHGIQSSYRPRRSSFDLSDSSSAHSLSVPSSATSSSVHLPLPGPAEAFDTPSNNFHSQNQQLVLDSHRRESIPSSQSQTYLAAEQQRPGEGGFSSAFGLMTIDDPNALANIPGDGVPFFSSVAMGGIAPHSPDATPMPARQPSQTQQHRDRGISLSVLQTPGELRDFWKAYVRTPLSGPGPMGLDGSTPSATGLNAQQPCTAQIPTSPSGQRRRVRVSSLPSVTPTTERSYLPLNGHHAAGLGHGGEGSRGSIHETLDDLKSYEAAVNARSASLNLNLVPRRRGTRPPEEGASPKSSGTRSGAAGATDHSVSLGMTEVGSALSRPSSSSSTSSLAHAFGPQQPTHVVKPLPMSGASISLPVPSVPHSLGGGIGSIGTSSCESRESSVASDGTGSSDGDGFRPSFKRLPSQTLGPATSKRALVELSVGGGKEAAVAVAVADGGKGSRSSKPMASLSEPIRKPSPSKADGA